LCARLKTGENVLFDDFHLAMAHIYHHLNSAWNGRYTTDQRWRDCSDQDFSDWQKFPKDLPLIGDDDYYDLPEYNAET